MHFDQFEPISNGLKIFDPLYGFIRLTPCEEKIINSPFFQRLRGIKQLGWAHYIFPGAEHSRFSHVLGVMHSMDQMIRNLGLSVNDRDLFGSSNSSQSEVQFHKNMRLSALLHDIGTFPFSHSIEFAYLKHGNDPTQNIKQEKKDLKNSHEHLGSYLIKNTNFEFGITSILEQFNLDPSEIARIIKGQSQGSPMSFIANQLMHSDLDADRLDYLRRDAHYTGLQYGHFDRDYILSNLGLFETDSYIGFGVNESAIHAVEHFLLARFSWYSQVIKNSSSAKYDILACEISSKLLEKGEMAHFQELMEWARNRDSRFFWFNDHYWMTLCQNFLSKKPQDFQTACLQNQIQHLIYRLPFRRLKTPLVQAELISSYEYIQVKAKRIVELQELFQKLNDILESYNKKHLDPSVWMLLDIPHKDVSFCYQGKAQNSCEPILILQKNGDKISPTSLSSLKGGLMAHLKDFYHFIPSIYVSEKAFEIIQEHGFSK